MAGKLVWDGKGDNRPTPDTLGLRKPSPDRLRMMWRLFHSGTASPQLPFAYGLTDDHHSMNAVEEPDA